MSLFQFRGSEITSRTRFSISFVVNHSVEKKVAKMAQSLRIFVGIRLPHWRRELWWWLMANQIKLCAKMNARRRSVRPFIGVYFIRLLAIESLLNVFTLFCFHSFGLLRLVCVWMMSAHMPKICWTNEERATCAGRECCFSLLSLYPTYGPCRHVCVFSERATFGERETEWFHQTDEVISYKQEEKTNARPNIAWTNIFWVLVCVLLPGVNLSIKLKN